MKSSPLSCDANGYVIGFAYHDGFLEGVLTKGSNVHLALRSTRDEHRILTLRGVGGLHVEGFREGNIILNLRFWPAARALRDIETRQTLAERVFIESDKLSTDAYVFILEGSFGADVLAVCDRAEISGVGSQLVLAS